MNASIISFLDYHGWHSDNHVGPLPWVWGRPWFRSPGCKRHLDSGAQPPSRSGTYSQPSTGPRNLHTNRQVILFCLQTDPCLDLPQCGHPLDNLRQTVFVFGNIIFWLLKFILFSSVLTTIFLKVNKIFVYLPGTQTAGACSLIPLVLAEKVINKYVWFMVFIILNICPICIDGVGDNRTPRPLFSYK